ncbi:MAG: tRNA pseudouridine(55) synthase TruB [bacterium]
MHSSSLLPPAGGVLSICKPVGMTSHDVVDAVRRIVGTRRVGHTGTLDPGAAGVLVLVLGRATRVAEFIADADKEYRVEIVFGRSTDTGDAYGEIVRESIPARVGRDELTAILHRFTGRIEQVPPMASAVHVGGRRLYEYARQGSTVEAPPREVHIFRIDILEVREGPPAGAWLHVVCSKGTYIRRLCTDIGEAIGSGAYAQFMVRTRVAAHHLDETLTLEEIDRLASSGDLTRAIQPTDAALGDLPAVDLTPSQRQAVLHGQGLPLFKVADWQVLMQARAIRLRDTQGLVAIGKVEQGVLRPFKVLRES